MFFLHITDFKVHWVNESPEYPSGQEHEGTWFITKQIALIPQAPMHGSLHLLFMHDLSLGHSDCIEHSGRQFGGWPK